MKLICETALQSDGLLLRFPSASVASEMRHIWEKADKGYNGYMSVELKAPYKKRTTGKNSQNNLIWKLITIIAEEQGEDVKEVERALKIKAIAKGYPYHISKLTGEPVGESMTKINTVEASYLIETAYEIIAFLGIILEPELQRTDSGIVANPSVSADSVPSLAEQALYDIY